jgi:hypothetical protein
MEPISQLNKIVDYIEQEYDFEIVPCSIPSNYFQYIKRNFYIWIREKNEKLFYFLRDKVSPIKFLKERPDGSIWLRKRMSDDRLCEIELKIVYLFNHNGNEVEPYFNYSINIQMLNDMDTYYIDSFNIVLIDKHLCQIPELKELIRDKKLENILNN